MKNLMSPQKQKRALPRQFRHFGMIAMLVLLLIVAFAASIIVSASLFSRTTREYREEIITKTASLAVGLIDGDRINP